LPKQPASGKLFRWWLKLALVRINKNMNSRLLLILLWLVPALSTAQGPGVPGVIVGEARIEKFPLSAEALGNASANESVLIRPVITATLTSIQFEEGKFVSGGTVLAELENVEALADLAAARATLVETEAQYRRLSELFKTQAVSESQLQQLDAKRQADRAAVAATQARLSHTVIKAPFDGRLGLRRVSVGSLVGPDTVITTLDDTAFIKLDFDVPEVYLARLEPGLSVTAHSAAWPDLKFLGTVSSIDTRVDPVSRTVAVRSLIDNADGQLRPGMFLTVTLLRADIEALLIPEQALIPERSKQFVMVVGEGDIATLREVRTGRRRPGQVEILEGLESGERVVVEGTQKARDGQPVKVLEGPP
jgi:membrane fusion protein (multidrug efflux system)